MKSLDNKSLELFYFSLNEYRQIFFSSICGDSGSQEVNDENYLISSSHNNNIYKKLFGVYETSLKEFLKLLSTSGDYMIRLDSFQNFLLNNYSQYKEVSRDNFNIDYVESLTGIKTIDVLKFLLFTEFDINKFVTYVNSEGRTVLKENINPNKYIISSPLKSIIYSQKEFTERRNSIIHRNSELDDKYKNQFINRNKDKFKTLQEDGYYLSIQSNIVFKTDKKYLFNFTKMVLGHYYLFLFLISPDTSKSFVADFLTDISRQVLFVNEFEKDLATPLLDLIISIYNHVKSSSKGILTSNKFLLSNLAQVVQLHTSRREYHDFLSLHGNKMRENNLGNMTIHWLANESELALKSFRESLNDNELTEQEILENIIFSKMDTLQTFLDVYRDYFKRDYPHKYHYYSTKNFLHE